MIGWVFLVGEGLLLRLAEQRRRDEKMLLIHTCDLPELWILVRVGISAMQFPIYNIIAMSSHYASE